MKTINLPLLQKELSEYYKCDFTFDIFDTGQIIQNDIIDRLCLKNGLSGYALIFNRLAVVGSHIEKIRNHKVVRVGDTRPEYLIQLFTFYQIAVKQHEGNKPIFMNVQGNNMVLQLTNIDLINELFDTALNKVSRYFYKSDYTTLTGIEKAEMNLSVDNWLHAPAKRKRGAPVKSRFIKSFATDIFHLLKDAPMENDSERIKFIAELFNVYGLVQFTENTPPYKYIDNLIRSKADFQQPN